METQKQINIQSIEDQYEKDILSFLNKNGESVYGDIFKELRISATKGQTAIYSLLKKGWIRHKNRTSYIELNVKIK